MNMTDILPVEAWRELAKEIYERFRLNPSVADAEGNIVAGGEYFGNPLCARIKKDPKGVSAICAVAGQYFASELRGSKLPMMDECDAAMTKVAVPVIVDGVVLGSVGCCGALVDDAEVDDFMVARSLGVDEADLEEFMDSLPHLTLDKAAELQAWLEKRIAALIAGAS